MGMAQLVVTAVLVEGRSKSEVARDYGVSRRWVITLVQRYLAEGDVGLRPRSRRPHRQPEPHGRQRSRMKIVAIRKELDSARGTRPARRRSRSTCTSATASAPAVSTIWRILTARGFVTPQPHKRPKSSYIRFAGRAAQRTLADSTSPTGPSPTALRRRDPQHHRRPLPAMRGQRRPPGVQSPRRRRQLRQSRCRLWRSGQPAHRQRRGLHRPLPRHRASRPRSHPARPRHQLPPLPPLSPADLRQGRTLPPDPQEMARYTSLAPQPSPPAASPTRHLPQLLQHACARTARSAAAPHTRPTRPTQSHPHRHPAARRRTTASATTRIDSQRQAHPAPQQPPPPHRHRPPPRRH